MRKSRLFPQGRPVFLLWISMCIGLISTAQVTYPLNDVANPKSDCYAFTNATIVKDAQTTLTGATLVIKGGKITAVGTNVTIPAEAVTVDCKGNYIYPSFVDIYTDYGMPVAQRQTGGFNFNAPVQLISNQKGAFGWNQAIRSDIEGVKLFTVDEARAKPLRD